MTEQPVDMNEVLRQRDHNAERQAWAVRIFGAAEGGDPTEPEGDPAA